MSDTGIELNRRDALNIALPGIAAVNKAFKDIMHSITNPNRLTKTEPEENKFDNSRLIINSGLLGDMVSVVSNHQTEQFQSLTFGDLILAASTLELYNLLNRLHIPASQAKISYIKDTFNNNSFVETMLIDFQTKGRFIVQATQDPTIPIICVKSEPKGELRGDEYSQVSQGDIKLDRVTHSLFRGGVVYKSITDGHKHIDKWYQIIDGKMTPIETYSDEHSKEAVIRRPFTNEQKDFGVLITKRGETSVQIFKHNSNKVIPLPNICLDMISNKYSTIYINGGSVGYIGQRKDGTLYFNHISENGRSDELDLRVTMNDLMFLLKDFDLKTELPTEENIEDTFFGSKKILGKYVIKNAGSTYDFMWVLEEPDGSVSLLEHFNYHSN